MGQLARRRSRRLVPALTTLIVLGSLVAEAQQLSFTEEKLGSSGHGQSGSTARDVNASGVIVGDANGGAVFWAPRANGSYGTATTLPSTGSSPFARGVNNGGVIVGNDGAAVVWKPVGASYSETLLAAPGGLSEAWSVNSAELIAGDDGSAAVVWSPNGAGYVETVLPTSVSSFPQALHVNDAGVVVGQDDRAVVWKPNGSGGYTETFLPLSNPGGGNSQAWGINQAGVIVGQDSGALQAAVWVPNGSGGYVETMLPGSGAFPEIAYGVSDTGLVVGQDGTNAVVWTPNGSGGYVESTLPASASSSSLIAFAARQVGTRVVVPGIDSNSAVVWKGH
jgi:hypothetical protein